MLTLDEKRFLEFFLGIMEEERSRLHRLHHEGEEESLFPRITDDLTKEEKLLINRNPFK